MGAIERMSVWNVSTTGEFKLSRRRFALAIGCWACRPAAAGAPAGRRVVVFGGATAQWKPDGANFVALADRVTAVVGNAAFDSVLWVESASERVALARQVVRQAPAVVVCPDVPSAQAILAERANLPVLFRAHVDPRAYGLAATLQRPGGAASGVTTLVEVDAKLVELLVDGFPQCRRLVYLGAMPDQRASFESARRYAQAQGLRLVALDVAGRADPLDVVGALLARGTDGVVVPTTAELWPRRRELAQSLARARIPAIFERATAADSGALLAYGPDTARSLEQLADYVVRVLRGARAGDLPVLVPDRFELAINLRTAVDMRLLVPRPLLRRATRVLG
ncbi:MAG: ABC transporter substrate-binding protein [Burkholderiales bacterium]|nr:ABC transporter substrate-binding protein [Burkholderiales bacterium]